MDILGTLMIVSVFQGAVTNPTKSCPGNSCGKTSTTTTSITITTPSSTTATTTTTTAVTNTTSTTAVSTTTVSKEPDKNGQLSKAVYVLILVIVVLVAILTGVVLCLKRQKITLFLAKVMYRRNGSSHVTYQGSAMITNTSYENAAISSNTSATFVQTPGTLDSGYTEIAICNLETNSGREYQTIDSLHEDQTISANAYGHLKGQISNVDSKTYSHMGENHGSTMAKSENMNYSHIGNPDHERTVSEVKTDITYNTLDTLSNLSTGRYKTDDRNTNDEDTEYDHARAGRDTLSDVKIPDEYAHLNSTVRKQVTQNRTIEWMDMTDNQAESHEISSVGHFKDSEKLIKDKMTNTTTETPNQNVVRNHGYEFPVGSPHAYLILEPNKEPQNDNDVQFHIVDNMDTDNCEASECNDLQSHTYFILEKNSN